MIKIPFATRSYKNRSLKASIQDLINFYPEVKAGDAANNIVLHMVPGKAFFADLGTKKPVHVYYMGKTGKLYAVSDQTLFEISNVGGVTNLGTVHLNGTIRFADNGIQMIMLDGQNGFVYDGSISAVTDVDFQPGTTVEYYDTYFIKNNRGTGEWAMSASRDGLSWGSLEYTESIVNPDDTLAILKRGDEVLAIGKNSIEFYWHSGASPFAFDRLPGSRQTHIGTSSGYSAINVAGMVIFMGSDRNLYALNDHNPVIISDEAFGAAVRKYKTVEDAIAFSYSEEGNYFYQITFQTDRQTWVYSLSAQRMFKKESATISRDRAESYAYAFGRHLVGDYQNGLIYDMTPHSYAEDGDLLTSVFVTPPIHNNGEYVAFDTVRLKIETGHNTISGTGATPKVFLRWTDNNGISWSDYISRSLGSTPGVEEETEWHGLGSAYQRSFEVKITSPVPKTVIGLYGRLS